MNDVPICIVSMGANTPIGRNAWSCAAAVRAGVSGLGEHPFMIDTAGNPMKLVRAPWLDIDIEGAKRFAALLFPAIDEACASLVDLTVRLKIGLFIGLPAQRPGLSDNLEKEIFSQLVDRYQGNFDSVKFFPYGHTAGFIALKNAREKLLEDKLDCAVIAGVDTYINPITLEWLESCDQLHGAGPLNNAWGFIPGEGAGAILLIKAARVKEHQLTCFANILAMGGAMEKNLIKTDSVCIGEGLTTAFQKALVELPENIKVSDIYCDMNGEPYRADEYGFACLRTKDYFKAVSDFRSPADCWGDMGAATGPLLLILASIAHRNAYASGKLALCWASSEAGQRAAVLVGMN